MRGEELVFSASAFGGGGGGSGGGGMDSSSPSELDDDDDDGDDDDDDDELDDVERLEGGSTRCSDGASDARGVQATTAARGSVSVLVWVADAEFVVLQFGAVVVLAPFAAGLLFILIVVVVVVVFAAAAVVEVSFFFDPSLPAARTVVVSLRGFFFGAASDEFLPAPPAATTAARFFLPAVDGTDGGEQRSPKWRVDTPPWRVVGMNEFPTAVYANTLAGGEELSFANTMSGERLATGCFFTLAGSGKEKKGNCFISTSIGIGRTMQVYELFAHARV